MDRISIPLVNPQQAKQALSHIYQTAKPYLMAGHRLVVKLAPDTRTDAQNRRLWAMLADISRQVEWHGKKLGSSDWKAVFTASLKSMNVVPNLDGMGFVVLGQSTSRMTVREMTELQDLMEAFGAEKGVKFTAPEDWR